MVEGLESGWWGKLERDPSGEVVAWHPLVDHCADVAACTLALLERSLLSQRLARLGGLEDLDRTQRARLAVLAGLHDLGKFNHGFQRRAHAEVAFPIGHVKEALGLLDRSRRTARLVEAVGWADIERWSSPSALPLLVAAICHHGRPWPAPQLVAAELWNPVGGRDPFDGMAALGRAVRRWLPEAFDTGSPLPGDTAFQHAFSGLVMLADWIGSDTRLFRYSRPDDGDRFQWARTMALDALDRIGIDPERPRRGATSPVYASIGIASPRPAQAAMLETPLHDSGSLTLLEAETGAGKTEAALVHYLRLFDAGRVDGLYFALPTRTAATQIHRRVVEAVAKAFPDPEARPPVVLAVPGYLQVDDRQGRPLPDFEVLWHDDSEMIWRDRGWAAERPKRYLAGAVVVGTIDQLLLSTLVVPHAHLRAVASLRHLLVVDEVHASDDYMTRLLQGVLERHRRAGGHALLMSATLGERARARLMKVPLEPAGSARQRPFPLITHASADEAAGRLMQLVPSEPPEPDKDVVVRLLPIMDSAAAVAERALDFARRGARVLVLRNTVRGCLATQEALEHLAGPDDAALLFGVGSAPAPHHSRFARVDRLRLDEAIEASFGKSRGSGGCVAVATQTVQQSLDLDADLMITDLCPMDVLLQRVGRLHRHAGRSRPHGFEDPVVEVLVPEQPLHGFVKANGRGSGPHGLGTVYPDLRMLEATRRVLLAEKRLRVPSANRDLVESALHPEVLAGLGEGEEAALWARHGQLVEGEAAAGRTSASSVLVDWTLPFGDGATAFPGPEVEAKVRTRLGADDRRVVFDPAISGAFGGRVEELSVPAHLAADVEPDAVPEVVSDSGGRVSFRYGTRSWTYDRLGLRQAAEGANE